MTNTYKLVGVAIVAVVVVVLAVSIRDGKLVASAANSVRVYCFNNAVPVYNISECTVPTEEAK